MFRQRVIAQQIIDQGGHYLMVVKRNQPSLYEEIETLFASSKLPRGEDDRQTYTYAGSAHGRLEQRTLASSGMLNEYSDWPGANQVMWRTCKRRIVRRGEPSISHTYGITSLSRRQATAKDLEGLWRQHWAIENRVHFVRDETLGEDRGRAWKGHTAMARVALADTQR